MKEEDTTMAADVKKQLKALHFYSGFPLAHDTYNAISVASDGKVYYVLSSESIEVGGQVYAHDPNTNDIEFLGDLTEICGEKDKKAIPQGKSHVSFYESEGKLYFSTHVGFYELIDGMDRLPANPPEGYNLYPGGHILSYDLKKNKFEDLAVVPHGEGMVSMTMDTDRNQIFGITWPVGHFIHYDVVNNKLNDLGPISAKGEAGMPGDDFRVLCRSLLVDPDNGLAYFSNAEGDIMVYDPQKVKIDRLENVNLRIDYFGKYDPKQPGSMGYNWRKVFWYAPEGVAYGIHGNSGYLFRFDPKKETIELVERITSEPSRRSGMFDLFSYGYLGFDLSPDGKTIFYLTGGPVYINGKRVRAEEKIAKGAARGLENLHLITYNIPNQKYTDHGPVFYEDGSRPTYVNSIAVTQNNEVFTLARFEHQGKTIQDLVKIEWK